MIENYENYSGFSLGFFPSKLLLMHKKTFTEHHDPNAPALNLQFCHLEIICLFIHQIKIYAHIRYKDFFLKLFAQTDFCLVS